MWLALRSSVFDKGVTMSVVVKCALILCAVVAAQGFPMKANDVVFHLYTKANPTKSEPLLASSASISMSSFSNKRKTIITIHDSGENVSGNFNAFVVPAHLGADDVNILAVDWRTGSFAYSAGVANVPQLGELVANFVNILTGTFGYDINMIRIVGVGLGAHAAGVAARKINGNVPHVIGLDPSLLGWEYNSNRLSSSDAAFVEVLHTNAGDSGYDQPIGHLDFYANGGQNQPMCGENDSCSKTYAYVFYAESITASVNKGATFLGTKCASYDEAIGMKCTGARDATFGGTDVKTAQSGIYSFLTNLQQPFAKG